MVGFEELMEMLHELESVGDVLLSEHSDGTMCVTFEDFDGFDEDWSEILRDYELPELVERVEDILDEFCSGDFYTEGELEGHHFWVGYSSFDI